MIDNAVTLKKKLNECFQRYECVLNPEKDINFEAIEVGQLFYLVQKEKRSQLEFEEVKKTRNPTSREFGLILDYHDQRLDDIDQQKIKFLTVISPNKIADLLMTLDNLQISLEKRREEFPAEEYRFYSFQLKRLITGFEEEGILMDNFISERYRSFIGTDGKVVNLFFPRHIDPSTIKENEEWTIKVVN